MVSVIFSDRRQYVLVDGQKWTETRLDFGVSQGSVLGPVLFILYTTPLTAFIGKHCIRHDLFADDTHLSHSESPDNYSHLVCSLQDRVKETGLWMEENKLKLNSNKIEAIRFSASSSVRITLQLPHKLLSAILKLSSLELSATLALSSIAIFQ